MGTLVYLDIDDEVTTAAARIREAGSDEVVLVVPSGSRIATSRMNFRLLARAAQEHRRSLVIVGPDAATRAMAEAAGLTAHATVGQYEDAAAAGGEPSDAGARALGAAAGVAAAGEGAGPAPVEPTSDSGATGAPPTVPAAAPTVPAAAPTVPAAAAGTATGDDGARPEPPASPEPDGRPPALPVRGGVRPAGPGISARMIAAAGVTAVVGLAALLAVVFVLPSATITITPRTTVVGPVTIDVRADPAVTEVDIEAGVVPALRPQIPLSASGSFESTGIEVAETKAAGTVTFISKDPTQTNRVPAGSVVSTTGGIGFRTLAAVTVPKAKIEGLTIIPGRINVRVEAVKAGPEANVSANAITVVPAGEDPVLTAVTNAAPTDGGVRTETPRITAEDVDAAIASLADQLDEQLSAAMTDPAVVPPPLVAYPETASRSEPVPSVDPESLVGQEAEAFELALSASGSVTAADPSLVEDVAEERVLAAASPDADIVSGSVSIEVGAPVADGIVVVFPASGEALETARLDADAIREEALGRPVDEAARQLSRYGEVEITTWPDWVTSVPGIGARVEVTITTQTNGAEDAPAPTSSIPASAPPAPAETTQ